MKLLILDEADEMLGMGFKDQIFDIYRYMPSDVQGESTCKHMQSRSSSLAAVAASVCRVTFLW